MEYGGFLPLELKKNCDYFKQFTGTESWGFNSGRSAIVAALDIMQPKTIFIPYYDCHVVEKAITFNGYKFKKYNINSDFLPNINCIDDNDAIVITDYFGLISREKKMELINKYKNIVFDNTQAFFSAPIIRDSVFNVYSCRKFFGVSDGAYLVCSKGIKPSKEYDIDFSWERSNFLLKSIELGTNNAYSDSKISEESIGYDVKKMSRLTSEIMKSIDYETCREIRKKNFDALSTYLADYNEIKISNNNDICPMVYPFLFKKDSLREILVNNKIYVPQWWKYLLDETNCNQFEKKLSQYLFPLPIDQRYCVNDMRRIADIIISYL